MGRTKDAIEGPNDRTPAGHRAGGPDLNDQTAGGRAPWWRHHFDDDYFHLHAPLFSEADSRHEVAGMLEMLGLPAGSRVLDVPCGWGRHTALLRLAGLDAFGADISVPFLHRAARRAAAIARAHDHQKFAAADIRALPFPPGSFDGAIDVFTSVGLFEDPEDDVAALAEIQRVLVVGGRLLLETMHRDDVLANYAERDAWTLPDGTEVTVRRRYDRHAHVSHEVMRWRQGAQPAEGGPERPRSREERLHQGERRQALRLYSAHEVRVLIERAGFDIRGRFGDWSGTRFTRRSGTLIVVAQAT